MIKKLLSLLLIFVSLNVAQNDESEEQLRAHLEYLISNEALRNTTNALTAAATSTNITTNAAVATVARPIRTPCQCASAQCACCTGSILAAFNQRACMNFTYEADDFAVTAAMIVNGKVMYKNRLSGKNPPPMCVRLPRFRAVQFCVRFSNIYFSGANMHTCINMEANYQDFNLFDTNFDCIRLGVNGVAALGPEEGGGANGVDEEDEDIEDYDDSARNFAR